MDAVIKVKLIKVGKSRIGYTLVDQNSDGRILNKNIDNFSDTLLIDSRGSATYGNLTPPEKEISVAETSTHVEVKMHRRSAIVWCRRALPDERFEELNTACAVDLTPGDVLRVVRRSHSRQGHIVIWQRNAVEAETRRATFTEQDVASDLSKRRALITQSRDMSRAITRRYGTSQSCCMNHDRQFARVRRGIK